LLWFASAFGSAGDLDLDRLGAFDDRGLCFAVVNTLEKPIGRYHFLKSAPWTRQKQNRDLCLCRLSLTLDKSLL